MERGIGKDSEKTDLAEERTGYAADRTALANERTASAWIRTGIAALVAGYAVLRFLAGTLPDWAIQATATICMVAPSPPSGSPAGAIGTWATSSRQPTSGPSRSG